MKNLQVVVGLVPEPDRDSGSGTTQGTCLGSFFKEEPIRKATIYLIPTLPDGRQVGEIQNSILNELSPMVGEKLGLKCQISQPIPIPDVAYQSTRGQYLAPPIMEELSKHIPSEAKKILGVADVDLYTPGLNFIFGQAQLGGKVAVISVTRLREEYYGNPPDKELFRQRVTKEALHELGHTFGLTHCPDPNCVMHFSNSLLDTDRKSADFCAKCKRKLLRLNE